MLRLRNRTTSTTAASTTRARGAPRPGPGWGLVAPRLLVEQELLMPCSLSRAQWSPPGPPRSRAATAAVPARGRPPTTDWSSSWGCRRRAQEDFAGTGSRPQRSEPLAGRGARARTPRPTPGRRTCASASASTRRSTTAAQPVTSGGQTIDSSATSSGWSGCAVRRLRGQRARR